MQSTQNTPGVTGKTSLPPVQPYIMFDGNAGEAMRFYQQVFGGTLEVYPYGESPDADKFPPEAQDRVMHAGLSNGAALLMASDIPPGMPYEKPQGIMLSLSYDDIAEAQGDQHRAALPRSG